MKATKPAVLAEIQACQHLNLPMDQFLRRKAGHSFYNTSELDLRRIAADPDNVRANLMTYIAGFTAPMPATSSIAMTSRWYLQAGERQTAHLIVQRFSAIDLHPTAVDGYQMGLIFPRPDPALRRTFQRDCWRALHAA